MHGAYTKIFYFVGSLPTSVSYFLSMCVLCDTRNARFLASVIKCFCNSGVVKHQVLRHLCAFFGVPMVGGLP